MLVGVVMCDDLAFSTVKQKGMMSRGDVYMYHKQVVLTSKPIHIFTVTKIPRRGSGSYAATEMMLPFSIFCNTLN